MPNRRSLYRLVPVGVIICTLLACSGPADDASGEVPGNASQGSGSQGGGSQGGGSQGGGSRDGRTLAITDTYCDDTEITDGRAKRNRTESLVDLDTGKTGTRDRHDSDKPAAASWDLDYHSRGDCDQAELTPVKGVMMPTGKLPNKADPTAAECKRLAAVDVEESSYSREVGSLLQYGTTICVVTDRGRVFVVGVEKLSDPRGDDAATLQRTRKVRQRTKNVTISYRELR